MYLDNNVIFILSDTIVGEEVAFFFAETMLAEVIVKHAGNGVSSLPCGRSFINKIVHLEGDALSVDPKDSTFPWGLEVDGTRLSWVTWIMDL